MYAAGKGAERKRLTEIQEFFSQNTFLQNINWIENQVCMQ